MVSARVPSSVEVMASFVYTGARFDAIRRMVYKLSVETEASYLQARSTFHEVHVYNPKPYKP